eukprot:maker-scaffold_12-snap-gene-11.17-mRNA-1 protein AED:0.02 eAED:0.02 QI:63/1/1/1/1/1/3/138/537
MVLEQLGEGITKALGKLNKASMVDEDVLDGILKDVSTALILSDVNIRLVSQLRKNVKSTCNFEELNKQGANKTKRIKKAIFDELVNLLTPNSNTYKPRKGKANVFMFVGLQGSGKTTSIAKFGHHYQKKGWKVCFVCCDTFRAGAFDQIKQNALKLRIPFYGSPSETDPVKIALDGVSQFKKDKYEIILVDTSGRHKQEAALFSEMQDVRAVTKPDEIVFVMDSTAGQNIHDQALAFRKAVSIGSVIITKLDGNAKGGGALSAVSATNSPITFIGTGEHFDEFEQFEAKSFVSRLLGMGDLKGLMNTFREKSELFENAPEMMNRLQKGKFTLRDMQSQFTSVRKMGNIGQLMSMVPGMTQVLAGAGKGKVNGQEATKRIEMFLTCMDSMTQDELDGIFISKKYSKKHKKYIEIKEKYFSEGRIMRIARGSGTSVVIVRTLLQCHRQFEKMVEKMGKTGLMGQSDASMVQRLQRNPQSVLQQFQKSMDPRMLQQMGGAKNMMSMLKEMGNMDMSQMMKGFGANPEVKGQKLKRGRGRK